MSNFCLLLDFCLKEKSERGPFLCRNPALKPSIYSANVNIT